MPLAWQLWLPHFKVALFTLIWPDHHYWFPHSSQLLQGTLSGWGGEGIRGLCPCSPSSWASGGWATVSARLWNWRSLSRSSRPHWTMRLDERGVMCNCWWISSWFPMTLNMSEQSCIVPGGLQRGSKFPNFLASKLMCTKEKRGEAKPAKQYFPWRRLTWWLSL